MQSSGLDVHNHVLETLQKVYVTLFGSQYGKDLFDSSLENMEDELFKLGMMTGGADVYKQLEPDNQIAHVSLAAYLRDSDAFVALVRDLYK